MNITQLGSLCSGHQNCTPRPTITASVDVFAESIGICRIGDMLAVHCNHPGIIITGSTNVFVNGQEVAFISSGVDCGSNIATGASTVFSN